MVDLRDFLACGEGGDGDVAELKLGRDPAMVLLFTTEVEQTKLHYVDDESVKAYANCPGPGCPLCQLGARPVEFLLLPVIDVQTGTVRVLRVATRRGAGALLTELKPHLNRSDSCDTVLLLSRNGNAYNAKARTLGKSANRHEDAVAAFLKRREDGLKLDGVFASLTAEDLREVPSIRNKLDAIGDESFDLDDAVGELE